MSWVSSYEYSLSTDATNTAVSYSTSHILLSYMTSFLGCITTLELLQRRTSTRGAYNWALLGAAAVTMGGISIWGMHFVANGAIILDHGNPDRQLLYKPSFTAISFFVPIFVLLVAFYTLGLASRARHVHVAVAGILTGAAVCGMHLLAQYGVENYTCSYEVKNLVGSVFVSVVASVIALSVFFCIRDVWTDSWWKRVLCGAILAIAVSGMHWTAAVGTSYHWKGNIVHGRIRSQATIVASSLSMSACIVLVAAAVIRGRRMRTARIKAQRLVLACAYFDEDGKLMVTEEGILPSVEITNRYLEKTFGEDELSRSHTTFLWVFRASRNWTLLRKLIPAMTKYIKTDPAARRYRPSCDAWHQPHDASDMSLDFATVFKQLFCMAAQRLADHIRIPLEQLGGLFEEPLDTGALFLFTHSGTSLSDLSARRNNTVDREREPYIARGKYLFVTRQLGNDQTSKFAALGYRFAPVARIAEPMSKRMQINRDTLVAQMQRMQISASPEHLPQPGVHLACFWVRPSICKSFDVLVPESTQNQLPYVTIQQDELTAEQSNLFRCVFDELTISEILDILHNPFGGKDIEDSIRSRLHLAIVKLGDMIGDPDTLMQARFSAKPIQVPCQADGIMRTPVCTLLTVRLMTDVHMPSAKKELIYVPLSSFRLQQQYQTVGWHDEQFAREVKAEFGHLLPGSTKRGRFNSIRFDRISTSAGSGTNWSGLSRPRTLCDSIGKGLHPNRSRGPRPSHVYTGSRPDRLDGNTTAAATPEGGSPNDERDGSMRSDGRGSDTTSVRTGSWVNELLALFQVNMGSGRSVRSGIQGRQSNIEDMSATGPEDSRRQE